MNPAASMRLIIPLILAITAGATAYTERPAVAPPPQEVHPQPQYLVRPEGVVVHELGTSTEPLPTEVHGLRAAKRIATSGAPGDPEGVFYSEIGDATISEPRAGNEQRFFVLDSGMNEVRVVTKAGRTSGVVGRPGQGPGEFLAPVSLGLSPESTVLFVGDRGSGIHVFRMEGGSGRYQKTIRLEGTVPESICGTSAGMIVSSRDVRDIGVVRAYGPDGSLLSSFGTLYKSPNAVVNDRLSAASLACGDDGSVLLAATDLGEIRAFAPGGELRWIIEAASFETFPVTSVGNTRVRLSRPESGQGFQQLDSIAFLTDSTAIVQIKRWVVDGRAMITESIDSFAIDVDTGDSWAIGSELPQIRAIRAPYVAMEEMGPNGDPYFGIYELGDQQP